MALFRLRIVVLLWIAYRCFESGAEEIVGSYNPSSAGKQFVFSAFPKTFSKLILTTAESGSIVYIVMCVRNCQGKFADISGTVTYLNHATLHLEKNTVGHVTGKHLHVLVLTASAPVSAKLLMVDNDVSSGISIGTTYLLPAHLGAQEYLYITPHVQSRMLVLSLKYTKTTVSIRVKDNTAYQNPLIDSMKKWHRYNTWRPTGELNLTYHPDLPDTERITRSGEWTDISLGPFQSFYLETAAFDLSGSQIKSSEPVMLIQGAGDPEDSKRDPKPVIVVDAAAPLTTWGTFYIVPACPSAEDESMVKLVTATGANDIKFLVGFNSEMVSLTLSDASDWAQFVMPGEDSGASVMSTGPITVQKYMHIVGESTSTLSQNLASITPVASWSTVYRFASVYPFEEDLIFTVRIQLAVGSDEGKVDLRVDEVPISHEKWVPMRSALSPEQYSLACVEFNQTYGEVYIKGPPGKPFLALLLMDYRGNNFCGSYSAIPSRMYPQLNIDVADCNATDVRPGDYLDNDCDGRFDEEKANGEDDDGDGRIDEDLMSAGRVNGGWGEWSKEFECYAECGQTQGRKSDSRRRCDNPTPSLSGSPCLGDDTMPFDPPDCEANYIKCGSECAPREWGFNCSLTCPYCANICDKDLGTCDKCPDGFSFVFCNETCPPRCQICEMLSKKCLKCKAGLQGLECAEACTPQTYGPNCEAKCGEGCKNRACHSATGECHECLKGSWGRMCDAKCHSGCEGGACEAKTGVCTLCPRGKWGRDCTLPCVEGCEECGTHNGKCRPSFLMWLLLFLFFLLLSVGIISFLLLAELRRSSAPGGKQADQKREDQKT